MNITALRSSIEYGSNAYLLESGGEYALVDPSLSPEEMTSTLSTKSGSAYQPSNT